MCQLGLGYGERLLKSKLTKVLDSLLLLGFELLVGLLEKSPSTYQKQ